MGSILISRNRAGARWLPMLDPRLRTRVSKNISHARALCMMIGMLVAVSMVVGRVNAQGEENRSGRSLISKIEPEYPDTLQRLYIGGVVRLELTVTAKGNVENVILLGGNPILGQSAMAAAKKWKYSPANSRTVVQVRVPFDPHR